MVGPAAVCTPPSRAAAPDFRVSHGRELLLVRDRKSCPLWHHHRRSCLVSVALSHRPIGNYLFSPSPSLRSNTLKCAQTNISITGSRPENPLPSIVPGIILPTRQPGISPRYQTHYHRHIPTRAKKTIVPLTPYSSSYPSRQGAGSSELEAPLLNSSSSPTSSSPLLRNKRGHGQAKKKHPPILSSHPPCPPLALLQRLPKPEGRLFLSLSVSLSLSLPLLRRYRIDQLFQRTSGGQKICTLMYVCLLRSRNKHARTQDLLRRRIR